MPQSHASQISSTFTDHIFCLKTRRSNDFTFSRPHRWSIYVIVVLETFVFSGCIFGWGPLVYVLKNEEILLDRCFSFNNSNSTQGSNFTETTLQNINLLGCEEQDKEYAFIFTISIFVYSIPSVFCGLILHHWGLVVSRLSGSLLVILGFVALGLTTREESWWLYLAMISLALGSCQLRFSAFQYCNLFPKYRSTAFTIISGSYAAAAGLFTLFQIGQQNGLSLWTMSHFLTAFGIFTLVVTTVMPWHHVPYEKTISHEPKHSPPLTHSLISLTTCLHSFYLMINVSSLMCHAINFNPWISRISKTNEEAGHYTFMYSMFSFTCLICTPLPGMLYDYLTRRASKAPTLEERLMQELKCPTLPLIIVTLLNAALQICFFFESAAAVYASLFFLMIVRPSVLSTANNALIIRFPEDHFDRLLGFHSTIMSCIFVFQYPFFIAVQKNFVLSMSCFIAVLLLTCIYPLHFLSRKYRLKVLRENEKLSSSAITNLMSEIKK